MCPDHMTTPRNMRYACTASSCPMRRQHGFSLVMALFVIVVLGLLAAVLYRTVAIGNLSVTQEVLSARAFQAAESGAQAGMVRLFPVAGGVGLCSGSPGINQNLVANGLSQCSVNLVCSSTVVDGVPHYQMTSTGTCTAGSLRAIRTIAVGARNLTP